MQRRCLSLFCGLGGGSLGFARAGFDTVGIDFDPSAVADYKRITGHEAHVLDLGTAQPQDLVRIFGEQAPDVVFTSPPCKGFSGCLPEALAKTDKYVEMCAWAERGIWLALEAWPDNPPRLIIMENVPKILSRGRKWLEEIKLLMANYGYAWRQSTHNCGELGGLAQNRRRFLGVARHMASTPEYLYEPPRRAMKGVGDVIGHHPVPGPWDDSGNRLHVLTQLSPMNWLRLALIPAGGDWRDLPERVTVIETEESLDPRYTCALQEGFGVTGWDEQVHAIIAWASIQNTGMQIADPRIAYQQQAGALGVSGWDSAQNTIIACANSYHGQNTADPRITCKPRAGAYGVVGWSEHIGTIVAAASHDNSAVSVADARRWPEPTHHLVRADDGVVLIGPAMDFSNPHKRSLMVIRALDGTWHRPLTPMELAALQSLPTDVDLCGNNKQDWVKRIGNAVPPDSAEAIAHEMLRTLDASDNAKFLMSASNVWVDQQVGRLM
jgi:site-specific DNA-cytosine methylase